MLGCGHGGCHLTLDSCSETVRLSATGLRTHFGHSLLHGRIKSCRATLSSLSCVVTGSTSFGRTVCRQTLVGARLNGISRTVSSCSAVVNHCPQFVPTCCTQNSICRVVNGSGGTCLSFRRTTHVHRRRHEGPGNSRSRVSALSISMGITASSEGLVGGETGLFTVGNGNSSSVSSLHKTVRGVSVGLRGRRGVRVSCCGGRRRKLLSGRCSRPLIISFGHERVLPGVCLIPGRIDLARNVVGCRFSSVRQLSTTVISGPMGTSLCLTHTCSRTLIRSFTDTIRSFSGTVFCNRSVALTCFTHTGMECGGLITAVDHSVTSDRGITDNSTLNKDGSVGSIRGHCDCSCRVVVHSCSGIVRCTPSFTCI